MRTMNIKKVLRMAPENGKSLVMLSYKRNMKKLDRGLCSPGTRVSEVCEVPLEM
jgi:hypothetical protein